MFWKFGSTSSKLPNEQFGSSKTSLQCFNLHGWNLLFHEPQVDTGNSALFYKIFLNLSALHSIRCKL